MISLSCYPKINIVLYYLLYVLCGYSGSGEAISEAQFGEGNGPILMDDVDCTGNEASLSQCSSFRTNNCYHTEDAGVRCSGGTDSDSDE